MIYFKPVKNEGRTFFILFRRDFEKTIQTEVITCWTSFLPLYVGDTLKIIKVYMYRPGQGMK